MPDFVYLIWYQFKEAFVLGCAGAAIYIFLWVDYLDRTFSCSYHNGGGTEKGLLKALR